jgi:hypothetical protein
MSNNRSDAKKKVVTTASKATPTVSRSKGAASAYVRKGELIFGKTNSILMLGGIALIGIGLLLMSGGAMPSPDVWDESIIYSKRRTLFGPMVIIAGLVLEIVAIFLRPSIGERQAEQV